tara:strand:- start:1551 stop:2165 length:615 start_codon:yes stop_codon:yes gene_type:complete
LQSIPKQNNSVKSSQFELFKSKDVFTSESLYQKDFVHTKSSLIKWRENIYNYQKNILQDSSNSLIQNSLLNSQEDNTDLNKINPFLLKGFSTNFWRSNKPIHKGPAMYFVIDNVKDLKIILYIGETNCADKRWKGYHDCKNYLNNYKESLHINKLESNLDIRFFLDVPKKVRLRRKLEKQLIYYWLPPFNKETRDRWKTTFTNN